MCAIALVANQKLYTTECDGIASFRRSFIGALVKYKRTGDCNETPTHDGASEACAVRQPRRPYQMSKGLRLLIHVLDQNHMAE